MASQFNLTAQINLRGPSNIKPVVADIKRQLGTISADVTVKLDSRSSRSIDTVTNRLTAMNAVLVQARANANDLNATFQNLSSSLGSIRSSTNNVSGSLSKVSESSRKVSSDVKAARTEIEEFGKQGFLAIKRFAAFSVVTTGVFAITNAISGAFQEFIKFDKELVRLQQVTGKSASGLSSLEQEITRLATGLGVGSESLLKVASTLAQAGLSANDTRIALEALAKTELAPSFDDLESTTEGAIAALRQFNLETKDLEAALGSINAVAAAFAVESSDIITAIQRTGGVFASASKGVSQGKDALNEFIAVFTSVRATTRESAETIATGLRTIFTRVQRAKTIDQLKEFGVNLQDLEGKFVGPFEAIKRLSEALNTLDPRDVRFSTIVEELGGFRQIGKVIPLIQQFSTAQQALAVAQKGQGSLTDAQITAQKSLANQIAKVREQFLALIRDVGKSAAFQGLFKVVLGLTSGLISLAGAFKPILPILAVFGAIKGASALSQFASGFFGAMKKAPSGSSGRSGSDVSVSATREKEKAEATTRANDTIRLNTDALRTLTTAVSSLDNTIRSKGPSSLRSGGRVLGFQKGGVVPGRGQGDKIPALLEPGEVVINNAAANKYGRGNLVRMNKYADGNRVEITAHELKNRYRATPSVKNLITDQADSQTYQAGKAINTQDNISFTRRVYKLNAPDLVNDASGFEKAVQARVNGQLTSESRNDPSFPIDITNSNYGPLEVRNRRTSTSNRTLLDKLIRYYIKNNQQVKKLSNQPTIDDIKLGQIGLVYNSAKYDPPNAKQLNSGGLVEKFMDGSVNGVRSTKNIIKGARRQFKDLTEQELASLSTPDLIKYAKKQAASMFSGMAGSQEFIPVPEQRITPELDQYLTSHQGQRGFWKERFYPFTESALEKSKPQTSSSRKMDSRTLRKFASAGLGSSALSEVSTEKLMSVIGSGAPRATADMVSSQASKYADYNAASEQRWQDITEGSQIDNYLKSSLKEPVLTDYIRSRKGEKLEKAFWITRLRKAVNDALDDMPEMRSGGLIQNFMSGSVGGVRSLKGLAVSATGKITKGIIAQQKIISAGSIEEYAKASELSIEQAALDAVEAMGGIRGTKDILGIRQDDRKLDSQLRGSSRTSAASLALLNNAIQVLSGKAKKQNENIQKVAGKGLAFGAAGLYGSDYTNVKKTLTTGLKNPVDVLITGRTMDQDTAKQIDRELTRADNKATSKSAKKLMISQIIKDLTGGSSLFLDFDRTLAFGADKILSDPSKPRFSEFSDPVKVKDALQKSKLSKLGLGLADLLKQSETTTAQELLGRMKIVTARPQNTLSIIQEWLSSKGLPIPLGQFKGVGGSNVSPEDIPALKAAIISQAGSGSFVDDDKKNIQEASQRGIKSYLYKLSPSGNAGIEAGQGASLEKIIRKLGGPQANPDKKSIDFISGLGPAAKYFGDLPDNIPTDAKRTLSGASDLKDNITNYLKSNGYNEGGKADASAFEEVRKKILEKYPEINFRISKRKPGRGFGYNIMAGLQGSSSTADFRQASSLQQLSTLSDEMAQKILYDYGPKIDPSVLKKLQKKKTSSFAVGGLAIPSTEQKEEKKQEKIFGKIGLRNTGSEITATYFKNSQREGMVTAKKSSGNLFTTGLSKATKGYGPRLYDIVMEAATSLGGMLTSDRNQVSDAAQAVWGYYFKNRSDVKKTPLSPDQWTKNKSYLSPKLLGDKETWPPYTDEAWILQSGYSKTPDLIKSADIINMNDPKYAAFIQQQQLGFLSSRKDGGAISKFADGGTVPAMVSNGEAYVSPQMAKKIGYSKLNRMNQADRNGMSSFAGGGISVFKGPGSGTSDSIGPIGLPVGSFVIRKKATDALGLGKKYNSGGIVGGIRRLFVGGVADKDAVRAQGSLISDIKQAEKAFAMIMGQLGKGIRDSIIDKFKGIESIGAGGRTSLGTKFSDTTRGQAAFNKDVSVMGIQIMGKKASATTETVAHEAGHLADYSLGGKKGFASQTEGTFQFELINKVKPVMEKAFLDAGHSADKVSKYLASNAELFAEFFAKASPAVRAIITSTTNAEDGMKALADHLEQAGHTYAGLEASDIDTGRIQSASNKQQTQKTNKDVSNFNKALSSIKNKMTSTFTSIASKASSLFNKASSPSPGGTGTPSTASGSTTMNTAAKNQTYADEQFLQYKAYQEGTDVQSYKYQLGNQLSRKAFETSSFYGGEVQGAKYSLASKRDALMSIGATKQAAEADLKSTDQAKAAAAATQVADANSRLAIEAENLAKQMLAINPTLQNVNDAAKEVADKLASGDLEGAQEAMEKALGTSINSAEAMQIAMEKLGRELDIDPAFLQRQFGDEGPSALSKIIYSLGGPFKATTRGLGLLAVASEGLRKSFVDTGTKLSSETQASFAFFENLGKGAAVAGELNIGKTVTDIGNSLKTLGGKFGSFGNVLTKYARSIQAGVAVFYALSTAVNAAYDAYNQSELTKELDKLGNSTSKTELAFKNLEQNNNRTNVAAAERAMRDEAIASQSLESRSQINLRDKDRSSARTYAGYDPTGLLSSVMGLPQEEEAKKEFLAFKSRQAEQASKLGESRLRTVKDSEIQNDMATANQFNEQLNQLEAERARLQREGADAAKITAKEAQIRLAQDQKNQALYKKSQQYAVLREQGQSDEQALATIYSEQGSTTEDKERRYKLVTRASGTKEEQDAAIAQAKALAAAAAENERRQLALANAYRKVAIQTENLIRAYDRASAMLARFAQDISKIKDSTTLQAQAFMGQASVGNIDRTDENVLGNIQAYSLEEVQKTAANTGMLVGGGQAGQDLENQIIAGKIIQDKLPNILANATGAGGSEQVMMELENVFRSIGAELPDVIKKELEISLDNQLINNEGGGSLSELVNSNDILADVSKKTAASIKIAQEFQKQYNDALSVAVDMTNEYTKAIEQATEYQIQASGIRINAENQLAETLGKNLSLDQLNKASDDRVSKLSEGLIKGGSTNPDAIFNSMIAAIDGQDEAQKELNARKQQFGQTGSDADKMKVDEQLKNMGKQTAAINNSRKALEELANDGKAAAEALKGLQDQKQIAGGSVDFMQRVLTADNQELMEMNKGLQAYTKLISGNASKEDINSLGFRKNVFSGLDSISGMMPDNLKKQMQARTTRMMLESTQEGRDLLSQKTGGLYRAEDGTMKSMTYGEALNLTEKGEDPIQKEYIDAYRAATEKQARAAELLGQAAQETANTFSSGITDVLNKIQSDLPNILKNAIIEGLKGSDNEQNKQRVAASEEVDRAVDARLTMDREKASSLGLEYPKFKAASIAYDNLDKAKKGMSDLEAQAAKESGFENVEAFRKDSTGKYEEFTKSESYKKAQAGIKTAEIGFRDAATATDKDPTQLASDIKDYKESAPYVEAKKKEAEARERLRQTMMGESTPDKETKTRTSEADEAKANAAAAGIPSTAEKQDQAAQDEIDKNNEAWARAGEVAGAAAAATFAAAIADKLGSLLSGLVAGGAGVAVASRIAGSAKATTAADNAVDAAKKADTVADAAKSATRTADAVKPSLLSRILPKKYRRLFGVVAAGTAAAGAGYAASQTADTVPETQNQTPPPTYSGVAPSPSTNIPIAPPQNSTTTATAPIQAKENRSMILDGAQTLLSIAGLFPLLGEAADLANSALYAARAASSSDPNVQKDLMIDAGLSATAAIPIGGYVANAAQAGRLGYKATKAGAVALGVGTELAVKSGTEIAAEQFRPTETNTNEALPKNSINDEKNTPTDIKQEAAIVKQEMDSSESNLTSSLSFVDQMAKAALSSDGIYVRDTHLEALLKDKMNCLCSQDSLQTSEKENNNLSQANIEADINKKASNIIESSRSAAPLIEDPNKKRYDSTDSSDLSSQKPIYMAILEKIASLLENKSTTSSQNTNPAQIAQTQAATITTPQIYESTTAKSAPALFKDEKLEADRKSFEAEKKAQEDKKFSAWQNRNQAQQEAWDADTEYNMSQRYTQEEQDAGLFNGGSVVYDDPIKIAKQKMLKDERDARIAKARKKKDDADRKAAEAQTNYTNAEQSHTQWAKDNAGKEDSIKQREVAERKNRQLEADRKLVETGKFSAMDRLGAYSAMYGDPRYADKYVKEDQDLTEKMSRGETLTLEEQSRYDRYRRKEKEYYDKRRSEAQANVNANNTTINSGMSPQMTGSTSPSMAQAIVVSQPQPEVAVEPQTASEKRRRYLELKNKGKLRISSQGLPIGRNLEEEAELGSLATPREQMLAANRERYLAGKKQKRNKFLARFRPEVAERFMTADEKAEKRSSNRSVTQQPIIAPTSTPVPSNLPSYYNRRPESPTGPAGTSATNDNNSSKFFSINPESLRSLEKFNTNFDSYVTRLENLTFDPIEHRVEIKVEPIQVQITGAAAMEGLSKEMQRVADKLITPKIEAIRDEISRNSNGQLLRPSSAIGKGNQSAESVAKP